MKIYDRVRTADHIIEEDTGTVADIDPETGWVTISWDTKIASGLSAEAAAIDLVVMETDDAD